MRAYSMDLRTRVLAALDAGGVTAVVADRFSVSPAWVRRLAQRRRQTGEVASRARASRTLKLQAYHGRIREVLAIEAAGCVLRLLPAYSPDFNPIEMAFAKLKRVLRTAAHRTVPQLEIGLRTAGALFRPTECAHYIRHCGY